MITIILSSASLLENYNRLYFNVTTDNGSQGNVYQYVSLLYSSLWNEAVMQKVFNTEFIVISNALHDSNLIRKEDILSMKELFSVYTNDQKKYHKQLGDKVRVVDIDVINKSVDSALAAGNKIVYFEGDDAVICHHKKVALGGTFDRIHNGHRKLLTYAASICQDCLVVGITSDAMLSAKANAAVIDNFDKRKDNVAQFLNAIKPSLNTELVQLSDPFGPAIVDPLIEAIVVSSETIQGAVKINSIRAEKGLLQLVIYVTLRVDSAILSSSFIRDQQENSL